MRFKRFELEGGYALRYSPGKGSYFWLVRVNGETIRCFNSPIRRGRKNDYKKGHVLGMNKAQDVINEHMKHHKEALWQE